MKLKEKQVVYCLEKFKEKVFGSNACIYMAYIGKTIDAGPALEMRTRDRSVSCWGKFFE